MAQKDLSEKLLISFNDVFADICNALIFKKTGKINPSDLFPFPTEMLGKQHDHIRQGYRDVIKLYKRCGIDMMLIGLENQTKVDYSMVSRMMLYDAMNYATQMDLARQNRKKRKKRKHSKKKTTNLPIISCVLYFGYTRRWTGPRTLHEWLNLPADLANLVNDYKIHVIEVAWLSDEERQMLTGDFRILADALHDLRTIGKIRSNERTVKHARELLMALSAITNTPQFIKTNFNDIASGEIKMCEIMDKYNKQLRDEGYQLGVDQGISQGINQGINQVAEKLVKELGHDLDMVARVTGLSMDELKAMQSRT